MVKTKIKGKGLFSRTSKVSPYEVPPPLIHSFDNKCLMDECSINSTVPDNYCSKNICFYNSTIYSLLNGYRMKKIIYNSLINFYNQLETPLKKLFIKPIQSDNFTNEFKLVPSNIYESFIMYKLFYFMCESKIDQLFSSGLDEVTLRRSLLKELLHSDLTKTFFNIKYSTETSFTILMFILKTMNYEDYKIEPFSIIQKGVSVSNSLKTPKLLILADSTAENVGISMKKLPLSNTKKIPPTLQYNQSLYSLECGVTFDIRKTLKDYPKISLLIPKSFQETPIYGHFEGNFVCRSNNNPDSYNPIYWDDISKDTIFYYTWVMYIKVESNIDIPRFPEKRYYYNVIESKTNNRREISTHYTFPINFNTYDEANQFIKEQKSNHHENDIIDISYTIEKHYRSPTLPNQ